nr:hypothetical protein CFP56_09585 [Quercus suber]
MRTNGEWAGGRISVKGHVDQQSACRCNVRPAAARLKLMQCLGETRHPTALDEQSGVELGFRNSKASHSKSRPKINHQYELVSLVSA